MSLDGIKSMGSWDNTRASDLKKANMDQKKGEKFDTTAELLASRMDDTGNDQVVMLGFGQCALDVAGAIQIKNGTYVKEGEAGYAKSYQEREKLANELLKGKKMSATSVPTGTVFDLNKLKKKDGSNLLKDDSKLASDQNRQDAVLTDLQNAVNTKGLKEVKFSEKTTATDLAKVIIKKSDKKEYKNIDLKTPEGQRKFDKLVQDIRSEAKLKGFDLTITKDKPVDLSKFFKAKNPDFTGTPLTPPKGRDADAIAKDLKALGKGDISKLDGFKTKEGDTPQAVYGAILEINKKDGKSLTDTEKTELLEKLQTDMQVSGPDEKAKADLPLDLSGYFVSTDPDFEGTPRQANIRQLER